MYRVAEALVACGHDIVSGIRPEHGHAALMDQRQQLRQRPGAARFGWVDRAASLALTKLAGAQEHDIALADAYPISAFGSLDVVEADTVAALDELDSAQHRCVDEHAARHDTWVGGVDAVTCRAFWRVHAR